MLAGGTKDQFRLLVEATSEWSPPTGETPEPQPEVATLAGAAEGYLENLRSGGETLVDTGIAGGEFDHAIGGGFEPGEILIFAALPNHGKSVVGLQFAALQEQPGLARHHHQRRDGQDGDWQANAAIRVRRAR